MKLDTHDRMLKPSEVATLLNVSERSLARFVAAGSFPRPIVVGKHRRFSLATIQAWIAKNGGAK
jgi:excisionase family DNA binding protein